MLASMTAGGMGYVFQILLGRLLAPGEYALFSAVMAAYLILVSPLQTLTLIMAERVATLVASNKSSLAAVFCRTYIWRTLRVSIVVVVLMSLFVPQIKAYLNTDSTIVIGLLALLSLSTIPYSITFGVLQGLQKFKDIAVAQVVLIFLKLVISVGLVLVGMKVAGATAGILLALVLVSVWMMTRLDSSEPQSSQETFSLSWRRSLPIVAANVAFTIVAQVDLILVNYYFPSEEAGYYAIAAVFGKAAMHIPAGITTALFPIAVEQYQRNEGHRGLLFQGIKLAFLLSLAVGLVYFAVSQWFVELVFGADYAAAGEIMRWYGLAMVPLALIMVIEHYLIARSRMLFVYLLGAALPVLAISVHFYHPTPLSILVTVTAISTVVCFLGLVYLLIVQRHQRDR